MEQGLENYPGGDFESCGFLPLIIFLSQGQGGGINEDILDALLPLLYTVCILLWTHTETSRDCVIQGQYHEKHQNK